MTVRAVIVNFNTASYLRPLLRSLDGFTGEITVVDSSSTRDGELQELERLRTEFPAVRLRLLEQNMGFGAAANVGANDPAPAPGDVLIFLNPDLIVGTGMIESLTQAISSRHFDIVGPTIFHGVPPSSRLWFTGGIVSLRTGRTRQTETGSSQPSGVPYVSGAALAVSRSAWEQLGGFREDLFMYWEDVDLALRACDLGFSVGVVPEAQAWHIEGAASSRQGRSALYYRYANRNRLLVMSSIVGLRRLMVGTGSLTTIGMLFTPLRQERAHRWEKFSAAFKGMFEGIRMVAR